MLDPTLLLLGFNSDTKASNSVSATYRSTKITEYSSTWTPNEKKTADNSQFRLDQSFHGNTCNRSKMFNWHTPLSVPRFLQQLAVIYSPGAAVRSAAAFRWPSTTPFFWSLWTRSTQYQLLDCSTDPLSTPFHDYGHHCAILCVVTCTCIDCEARGG